MFERFARAARTAVEDARYEAERRGDRRIGSDHLLLALLGIYGVLSYSMQLREQEMGIRIALGADRSNLVRLVMRQAAYPVAGGLFAGLALAMLATRAVESLLYQTKPADPLAMLASCTLLLLTAFLAVLIPALRAANADPARMLRAE